MSPWATSQHPGSTRQSRRERAIVLAREPFCYLQIPGICTGTSDVVEHVIPLARGGADDLTNKRGACAACNNHKARTEAAAGRRTTRRPTTLHPGLR